MIICIHNSSPIFTPNSSSRAYTSKVDFLHVAQSPRDDTSISQFFPYQVILIFYLPWRSLGTLESLSIRLIALSGLAVSAFFGREFTLSPSCSSCPRPSRVARLRWSALSLVLFQAQSKISTLLAFLLYSGVARVRYTTPGSIRCHSPQSSQPGLP